MPTSHRLASRRTLRSERLAPNATRIGIARWIDLFERDRHVVPALFALLLLTRLALILLLPQPGTSDALWYLDRAHELARGMGYQEAGHPTAFWPVGYPALLAASIWVLGPGMAGPMLVNLAAAAVTLAAMLALGRALGVPPLATRIAALLYALYPAHIAYAGQATSETASTAVVMVAFALLIARRERPLALLGAGVLFGLATLMRAQMMLFPLGAIVAMPLAFRAFRWRSAVRAAVLVQLALAAVVLPWSLRNAAELGSFVPVSTNGGVALFYGANDRATGGWFAWERTPYWDQTVGISYADRVARQVEIDRRFKASAKAWIAAHPLRWTLLGFRKAGLVWMKDSDAFWTLGWRYGDRPGAVRAAQALDQLYYMLLLAFGGAALAVAVRARWRREWETSPLLMLGCLPAFTTLTAFGFTGQTRYHYPAMPCLILAAGWSLALLARWAAARRGGMVASPVTA